MASCNVVDPGCKNPPCNNTAIYGHAPYKCYRCGYDVCGNCSTLHLGRRTCLACRRDMAK